MEKDWHGRWEFRNVMHHLHGTSGTNTVRAKDEKSARERLKLKASCALFGTTMMQTYITIHNIELRR